VTHGQHLGAVARTGVAGQPAARRALDARAPAGTVGCAIIDALEDILFIVAAAVAIAVGPDPLPDDTPRSSAAPLP
jgi:hypothetical protein